MKTSRKLNFTDAFKVAGILSKSGLKNEVMALLSEGRVMAKSGKKTENDKEQLGIKVVFTVIEKAPQVQNEIFELLAGLCKVKPEEIGALELDGLKELFTDISEKNDLKGFFTSLLH